MNSYFISLPGSTILNHIIKKNSGPFSPFITAKVEKLQDQYPNLSGLFGEVEAATLCGTRIHYAFLTEGFQRRIASIYKKISYNYYAHSVGVILYKKHTLLYAVNRSKNEDAQPRSKLTIELELGLFRKDNLVNFRRYCINQGHKKLESEIHPLDINDEEAHILMEEAPEIIYYLQTEELTVLAPCDNSAGVNLVII